MLKLIEKVKDLFTCKTEKKPESRLQQEENVQDKSQEQTARVEEYGSN